MIDYKQILEDQEIIDELRKIDDHSNSSYNHGIRHAKHVVDIMKKLIVLLNIEKPESEYLLIACTLHDIGQVYGSDNHSMKSREFAQKYLKNKVDEQWISKILSSLETHHQRENLDNLPLFNHLVLFADKIDFTCRRLEKGITDAFENHITGVDFKIENNIFKVMITSDKEVTAINFLNDFEYSIKIIDRIQQFASKLKLSYEIFFDDTKLVIK
ncbi:MAG: HD domain-containing protein [Clostridia bacterium]|nr:HD domain-containing protein [Clostridia bacterium]